MSITVLKHSVTFNPNDLRVGILWDFHTLRMYGKIFYWEFEVNINILPMIVIHLLFVGRI